MFASRSGWMEITWTGMERPVRRRLWAEFRMSSYVFRETGVRVCYSCEASSENLLETRHKTWIFGPLFRKKILGEVMLLEGFKVKSSVRFSCDCVCCTTLYIFPAHNLPTFTFKPARCLNFYIFFLTPANLAAFHLPLLFSAQGLGSIHSVALTSSISTGWEKSLVW